MILRWLDNKRKKKGENFESRYQEKLSLYEIAYREERKKKTEKDVEKYFQEMQKQKERREEILKEIQKVKNDLLS